MPCHFALVSNTSDLEYTHAVKTVLMNHLRKTTCAHLQMCPWFAHHLINGKRCLMWAGWLRYQYSLAFFASACGTISQRFQSKIRETLEAQFSIRTSRSTIFYQDQCIRSVADSMKQRLLTTEFKQASGQRCCNERDV